ncbi:MAG: hypothetical protein K2J64_02355 [Desulfovibrio sp.]|nr:hypothetical protein [Desulfovibrio sp.]
MRKLTLVLGLLALFWAAPALAAPDCYTSAAHPAHEFPFVQEGSFEVVSLDPQDGNTCLPPIRFYKGAPLVRQPVYAPLRDVYASYARALESKDANVLRRIVAYLRPTPRTLPLWFGLANEPETPPMELGGMRRMKEIFTFLSPAKNFMPEAYSGEVLRIDVAWPLLFLLMGGELIPSDEPALFRPDDSYWLRPGLQWRFPALVLDYDQAKRHYLLR